MRRPGRVVAGALAALLLAGCSSTDSGLRPGPGDPTVSVDTPELVALRAQAGLEPCEPGDASSALPAVTLPCLGGGSAVDLSSLSGPMVINLWGSACGPCRLEMPVLQAFHQAYGDQVAVLGVDTLDTLPGVALQQAAKRGATYPQLADTGGELLSTPAFARGNVGLPYTVVVDASGQVVGQQLGGVHSLDELVGVVDGALGTDLAASAAASGGSG